ncbi:MAG: hypothetical protein IT158_24075 [Bryobacterales bacterium]|nr:hypothetical protein [Bryobacterales bacterium]
MAFVKAEENDAYRALCALTDQVVAESRASGQDNPVIARREAFVKACYLRPDLARKAVDSRGYHVIDRPELAELQTTTADTARAKAEDPLLRGRQERRAGTAWGPIPWATIIR